MRKYDENITRKQWNKEPSQTLMNILHNADVTLAFKTYTIHKAGKSFFSLIIVWSILVFLEQVLLACDVHGLEIGKVLQK